METNTNAVALWDRIQDPVDAITKIGDFFAKSGMFGCSNSNQGSVLAAACMSERLSPLAITRKYHLLDGRLTMKSEAMLAEFRQSGGKHRVVCRTHEKAEIELTKDGQVQSFALSWDEVKQEPFVYGREKQLKTNWATPRARMQSLWARVVSDGVRVMAPEIVAGTYSPEEVGDMGNATPAPDLGATLAASVEEKKATTKAAKVAAAPTPTPAPAQPAPVPTSQAVIDVATVPVAPDPAPAPQPAPATDPAPTPTPASEVGGKLSVATQQQVLETIGDQQQQAMTWMLARGWLKPGQGLADLTVARANKIITKRDDFLKVIRK